MGKRRTDPGYGIGNVALDADDDVLVDEAEVTARLQSVFEDPAYRPPTLPTAAAELMVLAKRPDVDFDDVVRLLERDAMLTGQVMKLVQSPIYASSGRMASLKQAVVRIGLQNLRDLVLEASLHLRIFRAGAYTSTGERLRRHSTFVAHLCRTFCKYTAIEGEYAFLCGLLHDVGIAGCLIALAEGKKAGPPVELLSVWPALDRVHEEAGAMMARLWGLPAEIGMVVGAHQRVLIEGYPHPLAATVCLADACAHDLGFTLLESDKGEEGDASLEELCLQSHTAADRSSPQTLAAAREALQLTDAQMELILEEARELATQIG